MAILTKEQLEKERKKLWGSLSEAPPYFDINKPGYVVDQDALKEVNKWVKFSKGGEELNPAAAKLLKITPVMNYYLKMLYILQIKYIGTQQTIQTQEKRHPF